MISALADDRDSVPWEVLFAKPSSVFWNGQYLLPPLGYLVAEAPEIPAK